MTVDLEALPAWRDASHTIEYDVLLAAVLFGGLGYAAYLLVTWHPWLCLALTLGLWASSGLLSWGIAWLVMLGHTPTPARPTGGADPWTRGGRT